MTVGSPKVLRSTAAALWAVAAAVAAAAVWLPYRLPPAAPGVAVVVGTVTGPTTAGFDDLLDLTLRRPAVDPPPATGPSAAAAVAQAGADVRLAGIVAEPGHSYAVLVTPGGGTEVRAAGERTAGGTEVVAVSATAVTVRSAGRTTTLRLSAVGP